MTDNAPQPSPAIEEPRSGTPAPAPWEDRLAARLRGFGPLGLSAIFFIFLAHLFWVPLAAAMVLVWARLSRTPWREIGYVRPGNWAGSVAIGVVFGVAFKFLMKAVVMPLLGADPINRAYHNLAGNRAAIPWFLLTILGAGLGEETVFRGYAFERLGKLLGSSVVAKGFMVLITSAWFGWAHYANQGMTGAVHAAIVGAVLGTIFAATGRIFMLMVAHTAFDLAAYAMIYWNLETRVAHLVFK
jgi:uncharacterized protein